MLKLKCIGSGSDGNCYLLCCGDDVLILDCGVQMKEIRRGLGYNMLGIKGVCVTHGHADHALSVNDFRKAHIPVFAPYDQQEKKPKTIQFGKFKVTALPMLDKTMKSWQHTNGDGSECPCYAFLVEVDGQRLLYVTDTKLLVWNLNKWKLNHILIGLNYSTENLDRNEFKNTHVLTGHLRLDTVCDIIKANNTDALVRVVLCHMSAGNADRDKCIAEVGKVAGKAVVDVAERGKEWKLLGDKECPF